MIISTFSDVNRILLRSANWVGDAIMTTPTVQGIRENFPRAHITLLAKPWVMPVFEHNPHIDHLMMYDNNGRHKGLSGLLRLADDVKAKQFDLAILFQNAFEAALIAWLAHIPRRLGYTTDARSILLTHRIRGWRRLKKGHLVDYYQGLLSGSGLSKGERRLILVLAEEEQQFARQSLKDLEVPGDALIIGINPGATYGTAKRWQAERFIALSRQLIERLGCHILIFGGPEEEELGLEIAARIGRNSHNLCNRTSLREAMALIQCCHAFVTNDSGLMHVAAALDIPQVVIIGPTDPVATGPVNPASRIVQQEGICHRAPCLKPHCPLDHRCMTKIETSMVFDEVMKIIETADRKL